MRIVNLCLALMFALLPAVAVGQDVGAVPASDAAVAVDAAVDAAVVVPDLQVVVTVVEDAAVPDAAVVVAPVSVPSDVAPDAVAPDAVVGTVDAGSDAAVAPASVPASVPADLDAAAASVSILIAAAKGGQWALFFGVLLTLLVFLLDKLVNLKARVGSNALPWVAALLGIAGTVGIALSSGLPVVEALVQGFFTGAASVGLWELIFKHGLKSPAKDPLAE